MAATNIAQEISRLTAAKADLKTAIEGKGVTVPSSTLLDGYADLVDQIEQGGAEEAPEKDVNFYDYDGHRIASYSITEAKALTALPTPPSHEGLTFQEWNWSLSDIATYDRQYIDVGANYITEDGKTWVKCSLFSPNVSLRIGGRYGTLTVDWGDGTSDNHTYATYSVYVYTHAYNEVGVFTIKLSFSQSADNGGYCIVAQINIIRSEVNVGNYVLSINSDFLSSTRDTNMKVSIPRDIVMSEFNILGSFVNTFVIPKTIISFVKIQGGVSQNVIFPRQVSQFGNNGYAFYSTTCNRLVVPDYAQPLTLHQNTFATLNAIKLSIPAQTAFAAAGAALNLSNLEYIDIVQGWVPNVSLTLSASGLWQAEAMVKFFNKLGTTSTAITLTFGSTNLGKLTEEQKAIATNKGYTLA